MARGFDIEASNQGQLNAGPVVGPRSKYNFVEGPGGLSIAVTDNPANDSVDVTLDATGVGGGVLGAADAGPQTGPQPTVRLIAGANITVTLFEDIPGSELEFTIASTAGGFPGYGGIPPADGGAGTAGAAATVSRSDHQHPRSTTYAVQRASTAMSGTASISFNPSFTGQPFLLAAVWQGNSETDGGVGFAAGGGGSVSFQACISLDPGGNSSMDFFDGRTASASLQGANNYIYTTTTFNQSSIILSRSGDTPASSVTGRVFAFGS
jgi:hypothetical protein